MNDSQTRGPRSLCPVIFLCFCLCGTAARAATINAASCSQANVQTAITSANNGDTVLVPAGNCTWTSVVSLGTKAITLQGSGIGSTNITHNVSGSQVHLISFTQQTSLSTRITGFSFLGGTYDNRMIAVSGSSSSAPFRIDHNRFAGSGNTILLDISGNAPGLVDHNSFEGGSAAEMIHNLGMGADSTAGWSDDVVPGSAAMVFIEDNTFTKNDVSGNPAYFWGTSAIQSYYGARTVVRHNSLSMAQIDQHGTPGAIGARWWEIYENTFNIVQNGNQSPLMQIRAGSGVVFNNHKAGYTNGGGDSIEYVEEDSGYPALYQIGRGKNQVLDPAYCWGNDSIISVWSGSSNVQVNRDYYLSQKPGYTPFTYPYPLNASGLPSASGGGGTITSGPQSPTSLAARVQ